MHGPYTRTPDPMYRLFDKLGSSGQRKSQVGTAEAMAGDELKEELGDLLEGPAAGPPSAVLTASQYVVAGGGRNLVDELVRRMSRCIGRAGAAGNSV